jgi:glycosyltransferase involved in cell wall biosynthesis
MFLVTSLPVGGAETLLVNLIRRLDRQRVAPHLGCLKQLGPLGEDLAREIPTQAQLLKSKYDVGIVWRLAQLLRRERIDAVVTVGAGDKMFWGRLAARYARVPVILSALHSTGWPDGVGRLNRLLTPLTDGFIGVAAPHGEHLVKQERFPAEKVFVIPNGVDVARFRPRPECRAALRYELGVPADAPLVGIVAALRPEKNHALFLKAAQLVKEKFPAAHFVIVGDGPERAGIEALRSELGLNHCVHLLGTRSDTPELLAAWDAFALTSHNEANPVSILEALACGVPVVATRVGSIPETVVPGETGFLATPGSAVEVAAHLTTLLADRALAMKLGRAGRERVVARWSLDAMVQGYTELIEELYEGKARRGRSGESAKQAAAPPDAEPAERAAQRASTSD